MISPRTSHQQGHQRKFLVVIDETPECERAVLYAAQRAEHTGGMVVLLYVISPAEFQHWLGVESIMRAEKEEEARATLSRFVDRARAVAKVDPETVIREGTRSEEIRQLIDEDAEIAILVLAAGTGSDGPGPLVSSIASASGGFHIPVTIVPGDLSDEEIAGLA
ncbi:universal stress protein [Amorphus orientalis]|uniref:Nucleotide-binding universal stress UspA family protein n=1 Tax=Amorphus orientalis TaxID=649198 RepID=A0AAE4AU59_9HYPH|nr:universal stress protein [Amorphus orientalis]MDQ0317038.1 nucleotide-binding universal stress UspA family protein [Amorphus orientalis]